MSLARPVVIGNWKMNGLRADGLARVEALADRLSRGPGVGTLGICPPATLLAPIADRIGNRIGGERLLLGGQDCSSEQQGAHTGDVSAAMLKDLGCDLVIVGHSERRHGHGEDDRLVRAKAEAALQAGLSVILCIGETEEEWQAGRTTRVLDEQIDGSLPEGASAERVIVAYEPVWAIGTGRTPSTVDIERTHAHIRARLVERIRDGADLRLLYGGSVKAKNAGEIMAAGNVDGVLVGGASLDADEFWAIFEAGRASGRG
jgi:triosephosphate isomerase (TIM)